MEEQDCRSYSIRGLELTTRERILQQKPEREDLRQLEEAVSCSTRSQKNTSKNIANDVRR